MLSRDVREVVEERRERLPIGQVLEQCTTRLHDARVSGECPGHFLAKCMTNAGMFRFKDRLLFIANALKGDRIGVEEVHTGIWSIYLGAVPLARLDERDRRIRS